MGRVARGVMAIKLDDSDEVTNLVIGPRGLEEGGEPESETEDLAEPALLTVCENGYGKRTSLSKYRRQGRAGKGLIDIKTEGRNGPVIGMCEVGEKDQIMIITTAGKIIRSPVDTISRIGRNTMGVRLINLDEGEKVAAVGRIAESAESAETADDDRGSEE